MVYSGGSNKRQREEGSQRGATNKSKDTTTVTPLMDTAATVRLDEIHARYTKG